MKEKKKLPVRCKEDRNKKSIRKHKLKGGYGAEGKHVKTYTEVLNSAYWKQTLNSFPPAVLSSALGAQKTRRCSAGGGGIKIPNNQIQAKSRIFLMSEPPVCAPAAQSPHRCITKKLQWRQLFNVSSSTDFSGLWFMSQNSLIVSYSDFRSVAGRGDLGLCHNQLTSSEATCRLCPGRKQHYKGGNNNSSNNNSYC